MSSTDVLRNRSGEPRSDADLDAVPLPSLPLTPTPDPDPAPGPPGPMVLDPSSSADLMPYGSEGDGLGSSSFKVAARAVVPDPLLGALADDPLAPSVSTELPFGNPLSGETVAPGLAPPGSFEALRSLNFDAPKPVKTAAIKGPTGEEEEEEIIYVTGPNWPMVLLASYASAVTLALIWWVVIPRFRGKGDLDAFVPDAPAAAGTRRGDRSRRVEAPAPIPADLVTRIGGLLRVDLLEITVVDMARQDVRLLRRTIDGEVEKRDGGSGAMALRLRLRNTSKDAVFAPLDEAFLRDRDNGLSDSFVEIGTSERIYMYPLPVESEWSIVGQDFSDLKPGEAREARFVTAADFPATDAGMTWRLRLRTGLDRNRVIGVSVGADR